MNTRILSGLLLLVILPITPSCSSGFTLSFQIMPSEAGVVAYDPVRSGYAAGEAVTIAAKPGAGFVFKKWEGDYEGTENPAKITVTENMVITVRFAPEPKVQAEPLDTAAGNDEIEEEINDKKTIEKGLVEGDDGIEAPEMLSVASGTFMMGRPYEWNPAWGQERNNEQPVHEVYLDAYEIGKYPVTNRDYAAVLNWAYQKGLLENEDGSPYTNGLIYAFGMPLADTEQSTSWSQITFRDGEFKVRTDKGYNGQKFSMANHPVVVVDWYGVLCYCNWLSEIEGLAPCYNTDDWTRYEPVRNGYRPPTEAEWERAAAWDGTKHWTYGFMSDTLDISRANYGYAEGKWANPLDLRNVPRTSPVGWYNGKNPVHLSTPDKLTVDSPSPVGAYDMTGNVWEWCHDWWCRIYSEEPINNPTGPETGTYRCLRGCAWFYRGPLCRTAYRSTLKPLDRRSYNYGFRLARTP